MHENFACDFSMFRSASNLITVREVTTNHGVTNLEVTNHDVTHQDITILNSTL